MTANRAAGGDILCAGSPAGAGLEQAGRQCPVRVCRGVEGRPGFRGAAVIGPQV